MTAVTTRTVEYPADGLTMIGHLALPAGVERERLRPASWSSYGSPGIAPRDDVPTLSTGDSVRHSTLGEGVVIQIESGGIVTVRFADGEERRLMLDYAPLERIS